MLHRNFDGSLSRQAYLQINFDLLLDGFDTFSSPFPLVLKLESVRRSFKRFLLSGMVTKVLLFRVISSIVPMFVSFPIAVSFIKRCVRFAQTNSTNETHFHQTLPHL